MARAKTVPEVTLPATTLDQIRYPGPVTVFLPGDQMRAYRVGDTVPVTMKDGEGTMVLSGRTQGNLFAMLQTSGMSYAPMRNKPYDPIAFADCLEANLPDAETPCDIREFYTVLTFDAATLQVKGADKADPGGAPTA